MYKRQDGLYSWRYRPNSRNPVEDPNNATDGDLYLAWALLRAADRWNEPEWRRDGQSIGQAILRRLVVEVEGRDLDGTPAEFLVQSTAGYLAEVQPLAPRTRRNWVVLRCVLMALVTSGIAGFETIRLVLAHTFPSLKMLGLVGLVVLAAVSWTAVALGWSTDRWLRMFLWRRSLVMEEPSATLTPGAG